MDGNTSGASSPWPTNAKVSDGPPLQLNGYPSTQWLDAPTQSAWARNDMATIEKIRVQASQDLLLIYANIENKDDAWVEVESDDGETYYLSYTTNGVIWAYTQPQPTTALVADAAPTTDVIVSIGSYSSTANFLGISLYNWKNLPTTIISSLLGLGFAYLVRPIIQTGIEMGIAAAANLLVEGLAAAGVEGAAVLVPTIAAFVLAGGKIARPGFNPVKTLNNVVIYLNVNFQNDSTIFQGLGEGIAMNRDDSKAGLAVQCIVHRFSDNQIGAQGIDGSGSAFNSSDYYNNGKWVSGKNSQTSTGGFTVDCFTPAVWRER